MLSAAFPRNNAKLSPQRCNHEVSPGRPRSGRPTDVRSEPIGPRHSAPAALMGPRNDPAHPAVARSGRGSRGEGEAPYIRPRGVTHPRRDAIQTSRLARGCRPPIDRALNYSRPLIAS